MLSVIYHRIPEYTIDYISHKDGIHLVLYDI